MLLKKFRMLKFRAQALRDTVAAAATVAGIKRFGSLLFPIRSPRLPIAARVSPPILPRTLYLVAISVFICLSSTTIFFFLLSPARRTRTAGNEI